MILCHFEFLFSKDASGEDGRPRDRGAEARADTGAEGPRGADSGADGGAKIIFGGYDWWTTLIPMESNIFGKLLTSNIIIFIPDEYPNPQP